jgi:diguanylate cyclase (GGDEF)-like protein
MRNLVRGATRLPNLSGRRLGCRSDDVTRRWFGGGHTWLMPWPILVAFGLLVAGAGVFGLQALQREVHTRALNSAEFSAELINELVVGRNITTDVLHTGVLGVGRRADMDADVAKLSDYHHIAGLQVWALHDGHLIYADRGRPLTAATMPDRELARARRGTFSTVDGGTLNVFLSFDADPDAADDHAADAVTEVMLPDDSISSAIARSVRLIDGGALLVALFGVLLLWRVRERMRRRDHSARHDALTGLGNRVLLAERTDDALSADRQSALLLFDLDGFKEINDTLGYRAGDDLLTMVAGRLAANIRRGDTVARLGGDEFAVLLADLGTTQSLHETPESAHETAERLRRVLREPATIGLLSVETEASVGIALSPEHGTDVDTLLRHADVAMYHAKNNGLGVTTYDPATDTRDEQQLTVLIELRHAITAGELRLHYQPKCRPDGTIEHVEALVRWQHPDRGLLGPYAFLPLAEHTSLIKPLTAWVISEATRQCAAWLADSRLLAVAVNISPRNLVDPDLPDVVLDAIAAAPIPASMLELEITETAITTDPQRAHATLDRLHAVGISVSIDDFGVGYTSLAQLGTLPVDTLKIDQIFVADLLASPAHETVVRNVIRLGRDLGLRTVAEGVESHDIWTRLNELGCDEIQGYVLTPPLPPDELVAWLDDWQATTGASRRQHDGDRGSRDRAELAT